MDSSLSDRLEKLLKSGKITEEEKEELEKAIFGSSARESAHGYASKEEETREEEGTRESLQLVELRQFFHTDIEVNGGETFAVIKGKEHLTIVRKENAILITPEKPLNRTLGSFLTRIREQDKVVLTVPKNTRLKVKAVSSDVEVNGMQGDLSISTVSGDVEVTGTIEVDKTPRIEISTISGDVELNGITAELDVKLKSGDLSIHSSKVSGLIKLYSGDVEVSDTEFVSNLAIKTFSGDTELKEVKVKGSVEVETFYGDIDIVVKNRDLSVSAESKRGTVSIDSALKDAKGHPLKVRTNRGDISIKQIGGAL